MCGSLSQTCGHRTARISTGFIYHLGCPSADGLPSSKFCPSWRIETSDCRAWRKLPHSFIDKSVGEWRRRLDCGHIEHVFKGHVKCWLCVLVLLLWVRFVWLFDVIKEHKLLPFVTYYDYYFFLSVYLSNKQVLLVNERLTAHTTFFACYSAQLRQRYRE